MKIRTLAGMAIACAASTPCLADQVERQDAASLVARLPTNDAVGHDAPLEQTIAVLGERALPALERELRLGIPFRELNQILKTNGSRRYAVARVLSRISGGASTDLLVKSLSDPPDNFAMQVTTLRALDTRGLAPGQVVRMLGNHSPAIVLSAMRHAGNQMETPEIRKAVERVFDSKNAVAQFHNEYGKPTVNEDQLWEVRLAAGHTLGKDMVPEMRLRAGAVLAQLKTASLRPSQQETAAFMSYASATELEISNCLDKLAVLGQPIKDLVAEEWARADGDYAKVLDMALLRLGDRSKLNRVSDHLVNSHNHSIRVCAAWTLSAAGDRSVMPSLRKALKDTYHRTDGSCLSRDEVFPVRNIAAGALIRLGEEPAKVRDAIKTAE